MQLTPQQLAFFDTFGCLGLPGLLHDCIKDYIGVHSRYFIDRSYGEKMVKTAGPGRMVHLEQVLENDGHLAELTARARRERAEPSRG